MKYNFLALLFFAIDAPHTIGASGSGVQSKDYDGGGIVGDGEKEARHILVNPDKKEGGAEVIDTRKKTTVFSNWNDPYHKTGESFEVHPKVAEDLLDSGLASESKEAALETVPAEKRKGYNPAAASAAAADAVKEDPFKL